MLDVNRYSKSHSFFNKNGKEDTKMKKNFWIISLKMSLKKFTSRKSIKLELLFENDSGKLKS